MGKERGGKGKKRGEEGKRKGKGGKQRRGEGRAKVERILHPKKISLYKGARRGGKCFLGNAVYLFVMPVHDRFLL